MIVRRARTNDYETIRDLFGELDRFHASGEPELQQVPMSPRPDRDEFIESIYCANCFFAVAEVASEVVGFVDASIRPPDDSTDVDTLRCGVHNLMVKAGHQREGVGTKLMQAAEEWALAKGLTDIRLNVFEFNDPARQFYEQLGYRTLTRQLHKKIVPKN